MAGPHGLVIAGSDSATPTITADREGTYTFRLTVSDGIASHSDDIVLTVDSAAGIPPAMVLSETSVSVAENGGTATFTVHLAGLLSSNVVLNVTSSATGEATVSPSTLTFTPQDSETPRVITVTGVNDSALTTDSATISVAVNAGASDPAYAGLPASQVNVTCINEDVPPPEITTSSLPDCTAGNAYSATLAAALGTSPYSWSLVSGSLPPGLSLSSNGTISGTPVSTGIFAFTARVTDAALVSSTKSLTITISSFAWQLLPNGDLTAALVASGDTEDIDAGLGWVHNGFQYTTWYHDATNGRAYNDEGGPNGNQGNTAVSQVIFDNKQTTNTVRFRFDLKNQNGSGATNIVRVRVYGINTDLKINNWQETAVPANRTGTESPTYTLLFDTSLSSVNRDWETLETADINLNGTGYDYFVIRFFADNVNATQGDYLGLDNLYIGRAAVLDPYDGWAGGYGLTGNDAAANADPDGDGTPNLLEYALGSTPNSPASRPSLESQISDSKLQMTFDRIADPALIYEVWASNDLVDWGSAPVWSSTGAANVPGQVTYTDSVQAPSRRFLRLKVSRP